MVRRSKLEICLGTLRILGSQGPKEITQLVNNTTLSQRTLKQHLDFLIQQNFVEEQNLGKIFYAITARGLRVLNVAVPIVEEAHRIHDLTE